MIKVSAFLSLIVLSFSLLGQDIPVGSWRNHADFSNSEHVTEFDGKVFCASSNGLFYFDLEDGSINTLSTTDGLSSVNITMLKAVQDLLLIGYEDGLMDVIDEELNIITFSEVFRSGLRSSKKINQAVQLEEVIYLATDFGVVLYDIEAAELIDAFLDLGENGETLSINGINANDQKLYLSTEEGLLIGDLSSGINLKDFQNWERRTLIQETGIRKSIIFEGNIFALGGNDSIYQYINENWQSIFGLQSTIRQLKIINQDLYLSADEQLYRWNGNSFEVDFTVGQASQVNDFLFIDNQFYLADEFNGLIRYQEGSQESIIPQGPIGVTQSLHQLEQYTIHLAETSGGFSVFEKGRWFYLEEDSDTEELPIFKDVVLDLASGNGILLSDTIGLYSWNTEIVSKLSVGDSIISEWVSLAESPQASYWALVKTQNNLYGLFNPQTEIVVEMNIPSSSVVRDYLIVPNGDHYLATDAGLYIFDPESGDDRRLSTVLGNGNLPSNQILDLEMDLNGQLWIATSNGIAFFNRFQGVLANDNVDASQPIFEGFFLFDGIPVNHITVDGGNRKWMSTRDGLWLFDENTERNILHLRMSNSPIVNSNIEQMVVNPLNGELFFNSSDQFLSYRTTATRAAAVHTEVEVFPNPVFLSARDQVTVRGLAYNNEVKITDTAGNLIYRGKANGGTFTWDLGNYSSFRAKSGVYLVFSINPDGTEAYQAKFAILP